jgi:hypothetical protein
MHHSKEVNGKLLKACRQGAALLQPAERTLDDVSAFVADGVIAARSTRAAFATLAAGRNDGANPVVAQPPSDAAGVVAFVATKPFWSAARSANHTPNPHTAD